MPQSSASQSAPQPTPPLAWYRRVRSRFAHSIQLRMVLVFALLAVAMTCVLVGGARHAFSVGWRAAARPLVMDYVDHLAADIAPGRAAPSVPAARALTQRVPLTVRISGPVVNWSSDPPTRERGGPRGDAARERSEWDGDQDVKRLLQRHTADGHTIEFGLSDAVFERRPRLLPVAIASLLVLTLLAWFYVRRQLRPLDPIGAGAKRFGTGDFSQPIPLKHPECPDELDQLAATINTMGQDIHQMLEAKRALLLAISHELRSPLTRARLNTELLPEVPEVNPQRQALLRDLKEMAQLITDLLESERLATQHAALQTERVDLDALAQEVIAEVLARQPQRSHHRAEISLHADPALPQLMLDPTRLRLLLRNLLDNALRHSVGTTPPPELNLRRAADGGLHIEVRDHGPGVPEEQLPHLARAFYRPESARTRATGGVGLGLYLCKLVAVAHGGTFAVRNAQPGLAVGVTLPGG